MKKAIKILTILMVIFFICASQINVKASNATTGHTVEETGQQIANWAINFCNAEEEGKYIANYDYITNGANESPRWYSYDAVIVEGGTYTFDCVGWLSFVVRHATGLGEKSFTIFAAPVTNGFNSKHISKGYFEEIWRNDVGVQNLPTNVEVLPGDLLAMSGHVGIYVGNGMVADMWTNEYGGLKIRTVSQFITGSKNDSIKQILRVTPRAAQKANFEFIPGGAILPDTGSNSNSNEFEFNGLPQTVSYTKPGGLDWLFDQISQFFSFLAGMIINLIKYSILGYLGLIQTFIGNTIDWTEEPLTQNVLNSVEVSYIQPIEASSGTIITEEG